jgi:hypothetical protein
MISSRCTNTCYLQRVLRLCADILTSLPTSSLLGWGESGLVHILLGHGWSGITLIRFMIPAVVVSGDAVMQAFVNSTTANVNVSISEMANPDTRIPRKNVIHRPTEKISPCTRFIWVVPWIIDKFISELVALPCLCAPRTSAATHSVRPKIRCSREFIFIVHVSMERKKHQRHL